MTHLDHDIRRLKNGAIDIDYYRRQARVLRAEASFRHIAYLRSHLLRPLLAVAIIVAPLAAAALVHSLKHTPHFTATAMSDIAMRAR